jgi:hypothetical protein
MDYGPCRQESGPNENFVCSNSDPKIQENLFSTAYSNQSRWAYKMLQCPNLQAVVLQLSQCLQENCRPAIESPCLTGVDPSVLEIAEIHPKSIFFPRWRQAALATVVAFVIPPFGFGLKSSIVNFA